jgi:N-acyl-D-amino-acid deacylase
MHLRVKQSLAEGASGFSTGLYYPPNMHATTEEVIAVAEALRAFGGIYVHAYARRGEPRARLDRGDGEDRQARGVPVGSATTNARCRRTTAARPRPCRCSRPMQRTQDVFFDVYPYPAGSTVLMPDRLRDDVKVMITWSIPHPEMAGKYLHDIARGWNTDIRKAPPSAAARRPDHLPDGRGRRAADHGASDVHDRLGRHPARRASASALWGTFPRVLGLYARELGLFSMETAIHKMTGRTAELFGIVDRGVIREGAYADLVLFDPTR